MAHDLRTSGVIGSQHPGSRRGQAHSLFATLPPPLGRRR